MTDITRVKPEDVSETFSHFIEHLGAGSVDRTVTERLHELVAACRESGQRGSITLTISVSPEDQGRLANIAVKVSTKKPEPKLVGGLFFAGSDGELHQEDPRQLALPRVVHNIT